MMQAQPLQINRFPRLFAIVLFALAAAMVLGGALGYTLKSSVGSSGPAQSSSSIQQQAPPGGLADRHGSAGSPDATTSSANTAPWAKSGPLP